METKKEKLIICTFGHFLVKRGEVDLTYKYRLSKKPWIILKYLISHKNRLASKDALAKAINLEDYYSDPGQLIHNLIYRLRQMLSEDQSIPESESAIIFENGGYRWNPTSNNWLDTDEFDTLCSRAKEIQGQDPTEAVKLFTKALTLYKGKYLCENENDNYTYAARNNYHNLYLSSANRIINYYHYTSKYEEIIETCKEVLNIDYYNVEIHVEYLKALIEIDNLRQALSHYEEATQKLYKQAGINPSSEMTMIYRSIKAENRKSKYGLSAVQGELIEKVATSGALFCDIETFSYIYNLEKGRVKRFNNETCIVLLSLVYDETDESLKNKIESEIKVLLSVLSSTLRRTDVITKWSESQLLLLMVGMPLDNIEIVYKRITDEYYKNRICNKFSIIQSINQV